METVYFSHQNPASPISSMAADINRDTHHFWVQLIDNEDHDADSLVIEIMRLTGFSRNDINHALNAVYAMKNLPRLRELQEDHYFLTIFYLSRIMTAVAQADESLWPELDRRIAHRLTPRVQNEVLIQAADLAGLITKWIKELDPHFQTKKPGGGKDYLQIEHKAGKTHIRGRMNINDGHLLHEALLKVQGKKQTLLEALLLLLDTKTVTTVVRNIFTPASGGLSWISGIGYIDADIHVDRTINLDPFADKVEKAYVPSTGLRQYVIARDGHCRAPGCAVPAHRCQLDHVIPFDEGGLTAARNLVCLCQHHHNMKTDKRFNTSVDSAARLTWVGPMDSPAVTSPIGPLMETGTWGQTLKSRMACRFARIREQADSL